MARQEEGKVLCSVCGARAKNFPFGGESFRRASHGTAALSVNPRTALTRARKQALALRNKTGARRAVLP